MFVRSVESRFGRRNGLRTFVINIIERCLSSADYDLVIYIRPEFPIENDGVRSTDTAFQSLVDDEIQYIIDENDFKWRRATGSKINRVNQVLEKYEQIKNS